MLYEVGVTSMAGTTGTAGWTLITGSTPGRVRLMELGSFNSAATASVLGFGRPAAVGITPSATVQLQPQDTNDIIATGIAAVAGVTGTTWGTAPTIPSPFMRVWGTSASIGSGIIWTWPRGLVIPVSQNVVVWHSGTNAIQNVYCVCEV